MDDFLAGLTDGATTQLYRLLIASERIIHSGVKRPDNADLTIKPVELYWHSEAAAKVNERQRKDRYLRSWMKGGSEMCMAVSLLPLVRIVVSKLNKLSRFQA